jgi:hypothetical protein
MGKKNTVKKITVCTEVENEIDLRSNIYERNKKYSQNFEWKTSWTMI